VFNIFVASFALAAFAGLAALFRSTMPISRRSVLSAILNSGFLGLALSLLWFHKFAHNLHMLVGVCLLAGLGGNTTLEFILQAFRSGGLNIRFGGSTPQPPIEVKK
jgi:hypothetical protein